ncbi:ABC transporter permease [Hymenobacter gummosus]|uniref:ABC transporter permease n=1 Tax=Hymenobacter gummosus TaxID=1776032 RepID=A0A3S0JDL5_9BACT|nr:ABC transporter permease [Hymenobacter gummosus]RTQ49164.1 ABC transporter permease [Hymenobacter gummosus]
MVRRLALRLAGALATAWLIASTCFLLSRALGAGAPQLLNDEQTGAFDHYTAAETQFRQRLGLQQPLFYFRLLPWRWHGTPNQYHSWLTEALHGRLGASFRDGAAVETSLRTALRVTLPLTGSALLLTAGLALPLALGMARRPQWYRRFVPVAYLLDSLPLFVVGMLLLTLLASPDFWPLFPAYGLGTEGAEGIFWGNWLNTAYYLALPVAALVLVSVPALALPLTEALRAQQRQAYVATARAKGASARRVAWHHLLPNALPVFITRLSDLVPGVVAGSVVIEVVFALPGMGRLLAEAAAARDLPVLIGGVLLIALSRLLAWLVADTINALIDPRLA